jgi:hypothetical protein
MVPNAGEDDGGSATAMAPPGDAASPAAVAAIDAAEAHAIVGRAIDRYVAARHAEVDAFVDANYGLMGSLRLHRRAIGLDLLRAPANVALVAPHLAAQLAAGVLRRAGAGRAARWLKGRRLFLDTRVARELEWRLHAELLRLPYDDGRGRRSERDALAEEIMADPRLAGALDALAATLLRHRDDPEARARLLAMIGTYTGARSAAAELVNSLALAGAGAAAFKQLTPSVISLGPVLATVLAHEAAVASFPLGPWLGGLWYGHVATVTPSAGLVIGVTGGLMALTATTAAFAGVVGDPIQRALGLHQRRLHRLIDALGDGLRGGGGAAFEVRDHYAARIFDLIDVARAAYRLAS